MNFVIDLILIGIIIIMALISAKQGFVKAVIEVVGFVAAVMVAFTLSQPLANVTYDKVIEPPIINSVSQSATDSTKQTVDSIWESLPSFITQNSAQIGISKESLEESVLGASSGNLQTAIGDISQDVIKPVATGILETLYTVILIIVLLFIVKILAKLINKVFSFSLVGKLNRTLGGVLGVVKGLVIALIFCEAVLLIISFTDNGIWIFNNENIGKTILFKFLTNVF